LSNPYLDRLAKAGKNAHGKKSENRVAKQMKARLHPNSGAMAGAKSDASRTGVRMEMKSTTTQTMAIELAWLVKITQEALEHGQYPVVVLSFVDNQGKPRLRQYAEWVVVPLAVFEELSNDSLPSNEGK
jgi:hypothetical protein